MAILTAQEAAELLDYESPEDMPDKVMSVLVPATAEFLKTATGKDWGEDEAIDPLAKACAGVLLVRWFEDPGLVGKAPSTDILVFIGMLKAKAGD